MAFEKLPSSLQGALSARGYSAPTAVQAAVLEEGTDGRDLIVSAQTGSGKTVAFGISMSEQLLDDAGRIRRSSTPLALVIAPTRELALQVSVELGWLYEKTGARVATCVGGMSISRERRTLSQGIDIVVGTPGRLRDHLENGALNLSALSVAVLDEADEMLDMGFREDLETLLDATPEGRRTLLFSATMPRQIVALAKRYQKDALRISTVGESRGHGDIEYKAMAVAPGGTLPAIVNLLRFHDAETAILFCGTREAVRTLHASLTDRGFAAVALSGEHSQNERNHALQALRDGRAKVCVATDVAARGIDLPGLSLVIHAEIPRDAETMQHRSGRTGRAGRKGVAVLLFPASRRRRVESMLRGAKVEAEWTTPPSADAIRAADAERLMESLLTPTQPSDEDLAVAEKLLEQVDAKALVATLVQGRRALLPEPAELKDTASVTRERRESFGNASWFRVNVGRRQNADPRWLLPLLCRYGNLGRGEIGAIRIGQHETLFEVPEAVAGRFNAAISKSGGMDEEGIEISQFEGTPREEARGNKRRANGDGGGFNGKGHGPRGGFGRPGKGPGKGGPRPHRAGFQDKPGKGNKRPFAQHDGKAQGGRKNNG